MENILKNRKVLLIAGLALLVIVAAFFAVTAQSGGGNSLTQQLSLGEKFLTELNYDKAILAFEKAIKIDPMNVDAYIGLAEAYIGKGDTEKAAATLQEGYDKTGDSSLKDKLAGLVPTPAPTPVPESSSSIAAPVDLGPDYVIQWVEPGIEKLIRVALNKPTGDIMRSDLDFVTSLDIMGESLIRLKNDNHPQYTDLNKAVVDVESVHVDFYHKTFEIGNRIVQFGTIQSIEDIEHFKNIRHFSMHYNQITDVSPLIGFAQMIGLNLDGNQITDISPLAGLTQLKWLCLDGNQITDIAPLAGLTQLEGLGLSSNLITDIAPLAGLTQLEYLDLFENQITDIAPLAGLTKLEDLDLVVDGRPES